MDTDHFWRNFWKEVANVSEGGPNRIKAVDVMSEDAKKFVSTQITDLHDFTAQLTAIKNHLFEQYPAHLGIRVQETEDWWDRIVGDWSPDIIVVEQPGQADTSSVSYYEIR